MNRSFNLHAVFSLFCLAVLISHCKDSSSGSGDPEPEIDFSQATTLLEGGVDGVFNGGVVLIVHGEAGELYNQEFGNLTANSVRPIASATKWISGAVLLAMSDAGLFSINDPLAMYNPAFDVPGKRDITFLDAFTLSSGLPECSASAPGCILASDELNLRQVGDAIGEEPVLFPRHTWLNYGGIGMNAAAATAERISGLEWPELLDRYITGPLGMDRTGFLGQRPRPNPAGGLWSTPDDYMRFLNMIRNGGVHDGEQVLSSDAIDIMFTTWTADLPVFSSPYPHNPRPHPYQADTVRYGFAGWHDIVAPGSGRVEQMSSPGAFGTYPFVNRELGISGIIFTLTRMPVAENRELAILEAVRRAVEEAR